MEEIYEDEIYSVNIVSHDEWRNVRTGPGKETLELESVHADLSFDMTTYSLYFHLPLEFLEQIVTKGQEILDQYGRKS